MDRRSENAQIFQIYVFLTLKCPSIDADGIKFQKLHGVFWKTSNDHIWTPKKIETPHFENTECIIFDTLGIRGFAFRVLATVQRIKRAMFSPIWSVFSTHIGFGAHIELCVQLCDPVCSSSGQPSSVSTQVGYTSMDFGHKSYCIKRNCGRQKTYFGWHLKLSIDGSI